LAFEIAARCAAARCAMLSFSLFADTY
jgi:hypothetical protein